MQQMIVDCRVGIAHLTYNLCVVNIYQSGRKGKKLEITIDFLSPTFYLLPSAS